MRVAFVKHVLEPHGPWESVRYEEMDWTRWPSKVTFMSPTAHWKADWFVVDCEIPWRSAHYGNIVSQNGRAELMQRYTVNAMAPEQVPVEDYDLVIGLYPWVKPRGDALFAYMIQEHWDPLFMESIHRPMAGYDLNLDFMYSSAYSIGDLPMSISWPFPKFREELREIVGQVDKDEAAWIDGRVILDLTQKRLWSDQEALEAANSMAKVLGIQLRYKGGFWRQPFGLADPPTWGDGLDYLREMASCRYFISMGRTHAPGEAVCDAAALGLICIGDYRKLYHRLICHPLCMVGDESDLKAVAWQLFDSPELQMQALAHQKRQLIKHFEKRPSNILAKALRRKGEHSE